MQCSAFGRSGKIELEAMRNFGMPAVLLVVLTSSCGGGSRTATMDDFTTRDVTLPDGRVITAELADTPQMMARGLMFRDSLAPNHGMLFMHERPGHYPYWMHNCKIPLDIIWMDSQHRIVEISANTPPCTATADSGCPTYGGHAEAQYALELAGGQAKKNGLNIGDTITF